MAKFVIAGRADCPYFARAELLGDKLAINLPDFKLHKIVKTPDEWKSWLLSTCEERGWNHDKSPLVWRELIDRGGKGVLIGGANEFQEYAQGYYGIESQLLSDDMNKIAKENLQCKTEIDKEEKEYRDLSQPINICVTNASSNVCYSLLGSLCRGEVFGEDVEMVVHLFDNTGKQEYLEGVKMEVQDMAYGLVRGVKVDTDVKDAFRDCSAIILLDEILQGSKTKEEWIKENCKHFVNYAKVIDEVAKKSVKVLVAGAGPVNFNVAMMVKNAPSIPRQNFIAMSRLVENCAKSIVAERLKVSTVCVVDLIVWGNPNGVHYIDVSKSRVHNYDGAIIGPSSFSVSGPEMIFDKKWLEEEYLELVKTKRTKEEEAMNHQASMSQAAAINTTMMHWFKGSPSGQMFSLGVVSEGWYGVPKGLVCSYPVTFHPKGYWNVAQDFNLSEEVKAKINETIKDLQSEMDVIFPPPKPPAPAPTENKNNSQGTDDGATADADGEQRLETIVEEKKETSEDGETTVTEGEKTGTDEDKPGAEEGDKTDVDGEKEVGEKTEETEGKTEDEKKDGVEDQMPSE